MKEIKDTKETKTGLHSGNSRSVKAETMTRTSGSSRTAGIKNETNTGRCSTATTNHRSGNTPSGRTGQVNNPEGHNQYTPKSKLTGNNR